MTDIFLAYSPSPHSPTTFRRWDWQTKPVNILVSFYYLKLWLSVKDLCKPAKLLLDSGAFSAWNAGKQIDIRALTEESKNPVWNEVISLDVVGDPEATWKNTLWQLEQGVPVYPVFHIGEPWEYLERYCSKFSKVGLSARFGEPLSESLQWMEQCFARQWPHRFHSFGWVSESLLMRLPFDSADTASWVRLPVEWGAWKSYGGRVRGLSGLAVLVNEMQWYWDLQQRLKQRWKAELLKC